MQIVAAILSCYHEQGILNLRSYPVRFPTTWLAYFGHPIPQMMKKEASRQNHRKHNIRIRLFWNRTGSSIRTDPPINISRLLSVAFEMVINPQWYDKDLFCGV
jgi:hypothetical protein